SEAEPDFAGEEPAADQPVFEPPASARQAPSQAELRAAGAGESRFLSGKHEGRTIRDVYETDAQYVKWAAGAWKTPDFKAALQQYLTSQETAA
ncbi:MAG: hypothetical protein M3540_03955, partial [Actinomycetota bacterium]|nr:hypothetical protein [Actinomycetota bacterium]